MIGLSCLEEICDKIVLCVQLLDLILYYITVLMSPSGLIYVVDLYVCYMVKFDVYEIILSGIEHNRRRYILVHQ